MKPILYLQAKKIDYEVHIQLLGNTKPHTPLGEKEGVAQDSSSSDQSTKKKKRKKKKLAGGGAEPVIMATAGLRGKGRWVCIKWEREREVGVH